ncbi:hypothetical protein [Luteibacter sp. 9135]|uniref:hypothetical protein n=1 Tax=Luteibacter sp. 9135 TaxID=1500893 RepID=UPI001639EC55|nr:hypothetical protein [Luteibacter sp. 9135]
MEERLGRYHAKKDTARYKPILLKKTFHTLRQIVPVAEVTQNASGLERPVKATCRLMRGTSLTRTNMLL